MRSIRDCYCSLLDYTPLEVAVWKITCATSSYIYFDGRGIAKRTQLVVVMTDYLDCHNSNIIITSFVIPDFAVSVTPLSQVLHISRDHHQSWLIHRQLDCPHLQVPVSLRKSGLGKSFLKNYISTQSSVHKSTLQIHYSTNGWACWKSARSLKCLLLPIKTRSN